MPFRSKAQWRWAFANRKRFAKKWARKTRSFKSLPARKRGGFAKSRRKRR